MDTYIQTTKDNIGDLMRQEYQHYRHITDPYLIEGKEYYVCKNVNFQIRMTLACNAKCKFCIEKVNKQKMCVEYQKYLNSIEESLQSLHLKGIYPSVTITGGEPLLFKDRFFAILEILKRLGVKKFNLNTNGSLLDKEALIKIAESGMPHLNISRHHHEESVNQNILELHSEDPLYDLSFVKDNIGGGKWGNPTRIRLQCVLIKGYIDDLTSIKQYLDWVIEQDLDNVAFRGLSSLNEESICTDLGQYCKEKSVDIFEVLQNISQDADFKLVAQNISDHYTYEDWLYKGKVDVHFAYSDMHILQEYEQKELENGELFAREFVFYEDGEFCGGWNKQIKLIKKF